ncbi:MAG: hypothetical protein IPM99_13430 [Rubrivivax sp.]|nr:hypothetical protein [Rubrivivax sp.]
MPIEAAVVLAALGLALAIHFRRQLLRFAVLLGMLVGLTFIWSGGIQATWIRVALTLALLMAAGYAVGKLKLDERTPAAGPASKRARSSPYKPVCSACNGTGRKLCCACSGSGQGPDSRAHVLGQAVNCVYCGGSGRMRCDCLL